MNRIDHVFRKSEKPLLNVYFTAGYPQLDDTIRVAEAVENSGADLIEIGLPYSDPIADGPTIQESSNQAIANGMTIEKLFEQLSELRKHVSIPVILMGYINPALQYGFEKFCEKCAEVGVDGLILPDLPILEYDEQYRPILEKNGLYNIFLITPQTSEERIRKIDELSNGFIYMVSSSSITGAKSGLSDEQIAYFERVETMNLRNPRLIGFGISNYETFSRASEFAAGAIVGSAFIKQLAQDSSNDAILTFIQELKYNKS